MAIFDIPEKGRRERDAIRGVLKLIGFYQLQKSVYIYPYEIPGDIVNYLKMSGLLQFIRFARVDKMDDETFLKKHFKL
jgi:CRISPR-associated endonuclease Cas2